MALATWTELTGTMNSHDIALLSAFRDMTLSVGECTERISRTEISFVHERSFATGLILSHRLELGIHLLHEVNHPLLLLAFYTTQRVITHRLRVTEVQQLDDSIRGLLEEAWATVGLGFRKSKHRLSDL